MVRFSLRTLAARLHARSGGLRRRARTAARRGQDREPGAPGERLRRLVERYWDDYRSANPQKLPLGPDTRYDAAGG